jgi:hypothetical protein
MDKIVVWETNIENWTECLQQTTRQGLENLSGEIPAPITPVWTHAPEHHCILRENDPCWDLRGKVDWGRMSIPGTSGPIEQRFDLGFIPEIPFEGMTYPTA